MLVSSCVIFVSACSGGESSGPGVNGGGDEGTPVSILLEIVSNDGTVTASLDGEPQSEGSGFMNVPSGTREISGSFTGTFMRISFGGFVGPGGVKLNSPSSVSGPSPSVTKCSVSYTRSGSGSSTFRMRFVVDSKTTEHC